MSHYLVLGAGKMGVVLANDLIESDARNRVTLVDIDQSQLQRATAAVQSERLSIVQTNIEVEKERERVFKEKDVVLNALLHKHSLMSLESAVRCGVHFVDLVGEGTTARLKFAEEAMKRNVIILSGVGVSPGITNVCVGRAVYLLDVTQSARIYCGGNPVQAKPPLNYRIVYAIDSLINFYQRPAVILKDGKIVEFSALSDIEAISFAPDFPEMECFYTDGLSSLLQTMKGKITKDLYEKTVRHKGHAQGFETLKECGLFSREPVQVANQKVIPRHVLEALLEDRMRLKDEKDATLLRIIVEGRKSGRAETHVFEMVDYFDCDKGYTSMAKTTSFPASIAAQMIAAGRVSQRGVVFPEKIFDGDLFPDFMEGLKKRGVIISHKVV
jgi:lysine 6-dehydrogenase